MVKILLIGIGVGAASALLFASLVSGSLLSIFLFYLSPLPLLIAAIGWSHWAALFAALFAATGLALVFGMFFFIAFLIGIGLPAWWLGYLALLGRPSATGDSLDWYPPGNLVAWAALLGALVVVAALPSFGTDEASLRATLKSGIERVLRIQMRTPANVPLELPGRADLNRVVDILVLVIPPAAAVFATLTNALNLWLAGRIVKVSGPSQAAVARPVGNGISGLLAADPCGRRHRLVPVGCHRNRLGCARREPVDGLCGCSASRYCTPSPAGWTAAASCLPASMPQSRCSIGRSLIMMLLGTGRRRARHPRPRGPKTPPAGPPPSPPPI